MRAIVGASSAFFEGDGERLGDGCHVVQCVRGGGQALLKVAVAEAARPDDLVALEEGDARADRVQIDHSLEDELF